MLSSELKNVKYGWFSGNMEKFNWEHINQNANGQNPNYIILELQVSCLYKHYKAQKFCYIFPNRSSSKSCSEVWLQVQSGIWSLDVFSPKRSTHS